MSDPAPETKETSPAPKPVEKRPAANGTEPGIMAGALVILWLLMAGAWKTVEVIAVTISILARAFS